MCRRSAARSADALSVCRTRMPPPLSGHTRNPPARHPAHRLGGRRVLTRDVWFEKIYKCVRVCVCACVRVHYIIYRGRPARRRRRDSRDRGGRYPTDPAAPVHHAAEWTCTDLVSLTGGRSLSGVWNPLLALRLRLCPRGRPRLRLIGQSAHVQAAAAARQVDGPADAAPPAAGPAEGGLTCPDEPLADAGRRSARARRCLARPCA